MTLIEESNHETKDEYACATILMLLEQLVRHCCARCFANFEVIL